MVLRLFYIGNGCIERGAVTVGVKMTGLRRSS